MRLYYIFDLTNESLAVMLNRDSNMAGKAISYLFINHKYSFTCSKLNGLHWI